MPGLFRQELTAEEIDRFQQWARENYRPFDPIDGLWHPVVQAECVKINNETGKRWPEGKGETHAHGDALLDRS